MIIYYISQGRKCRRNHNGSHVLATPFCYRFPPFAIRIKVLEYVDIVIKRVHVFFIYN